MARPRQITSLQLAMGVFCAFIASLMLVAPHQFSGPLWSAMGQYLPWAGAVFLLVALGLLGCAVLGAPRRWVLLSHFAAAAAMLSFVVNFAQTGVLPGMSFNLALALGTAFLPFVPRVETPERHDSGYLLALLFGAVNVALGLTILLLPHQFSPSIYDTVRPYLSLYGVTFLLTSTALILAQFRPNMPAPLFRSAHLAALLPSLAWALAVSIPGAGWIGILFFAGFSPVVAALPWTGPRLRQLDPHSFSVRLAFTLALAVALPLIVVTGVVTGGQEQKARADSEAAMEASALSTATDVANFVALHRAAIVGLAALPGLLDQTPEAQHSALKAFASAYPEVYSFSTVDLAGDRVARADDIPPQATRAGQLARRLAETKRAQIQTMISPTTDEPVLAMGVPVIGPDGAVKGYVAEGIELAAVEKAVAQATSLSEARAYLVDERGHVIAHPDSSVVASFADLTSTPQVAAALASEADHGVVSSSGPGGDVLAAYARVPGLGWAVVLDQPAALALASVRSARNTAFGLLLAAILLAIVAGSLTARQQVRPLAALSRATARLALGDSEASLPRGGSGEIEALMASFEEMREDLVARTSERERLLAELRESDEHLRTMADAIPQLAWMARPDGFIYWYNRRWYEYTGTTPEQMEGWGWQIVHDPEMLPKVLERWRESIATGEPFEMDFPLRGADGRFRWFLTRVAPMKESGGRVVQWFGTNTDISERKEAEAERERLLEAEREAREQAEGSLRLRNEFLSVAAHELKTPIASLKGYSQVIARKHKGGTLTEEQLLHALAQIDKQSTRLARLAEQLLDVSRLEAGKVGIQPEEADVASVVEVALASVREVYPTRNFLLRKAAPVRSLLDPLRMEQVVTNLLDNAVKFAPADSPVEIDVGPDGSDRVAISVRDYGQGIPEDERGRIFERFYQAHPAEHFGGMGLGLYVSREIVEMHGGTITCEAPAGTGSLFVVRLPIAAGNSAG